MFKKFLISIAFYFSPVFASELYPPISSIDSFERNSLNQFALSGSSSSASSTMSSFFGFFKDSQVGSNFSATVDFKCSSILRLDDKNLITSASYSGPVYVSKVNYTDNMVYKNTEDLKNLRVFMNPQGLQYTRRNVGYTFQNLVTYNNFLKTSASQVQRNVCSLFSEFDDCKESIPVSVAQVQYDKFGTPVSLFIQTVKFELNHMEVTSALCVSGAAVTYD